MDAFIVAATKLGFCVYDDSAADLPEAVAARLDNALRASYASYESQDVQYSRLGDSAAAQLAANPTASNSTNQAHS
jgi:hypothetical protein